MNIAHGTYSKEPYFLNVVWCLYGLIAETAEPILMELSFAG